MKIPRVKLGKIPLVRTVIHRYIEYPGKFKSLGCGYLYCMPASLELNENLR